MIDAVQMFVLITFVADRYGLIHIFLLGRNDWYLVYVKKMQIVRSNALIRHKANLAFVFLKMP